MTETEELLTRHTERVTLAKQTLTGVNNLDKRLALHEQADAHVHATMSTQIAALEAVKEATSKRQVTSLEKTIATWKGRVWSLAAVFIAASFVGLVTHYLSTN